MEKYENGLLACRAAFERLKRGGNVLEVHERLSPGKITPGIVSVEAGFDRGYLKGKQPTHVPLIEEIYAYREHVKLSTPDARDNLAKLKQDYDHLKSTYDDMQFLLQKVVAQNLQLVARVRTLEGLLKNTTNVKNFEL